MPYPACKWRIPHPAVGRHLYSRWHNTSFEQWWGRPELISLVLAVAADYARLYPGEPLVVGDLDAPGPRHVTHDRGRDVDLYLPGAMAMGHPDDREYHDNYAERSDLTVRMLRGRVQDLARIVATCARGKVRIYYNDSVVERRFLSWFDEEGFETPFGEAMQRHNELHWFHFHVTIAEDLALLPFVSP
jgi:hypothetical protein